MRLRLQDLLLPWVLVGAQPPAAAIAQLPSLKVEGSPLTRFRPSFDKTSTRREQRQRLLISVSTSILPFLLSPRCRYLHDVILSPRCHGYIADFRYLPETATWVTYLHQPSRTKNSLRPNLRKLSRGLFAPIAPPQSNCLHLSGQASEERHRREYHHESHADTR